MYATEQTTQIEAPYIIVEAIHDETLVHKFDDRDEARKVYERLQAVTYANVLFPFMRIDKPDGPLMLRDIFRIEKPFAIEYSKAYDELELDMFPSSHWDYSKSADTLEQAEEEMESVALYMGQRGEEDPDEFYWRPCRIIHQDSGTVIYTTRDLEPDVGGWLEYLRENE